MVLFVVLYKVFLLYKSVDETLVCDHSDESYRAVLDAVSFIMLYKVHNVVQAFN